MFWIHPLLIILTAGGISIAHLLQMHNSIWMICAALLSILIAACAAMLSSIRSLNYLGDFLEDRRSDWKTELLEASPYVITCASCVGAMIALFVGAHSIIAWCAIAGLVCLLAAKLIAAARSILIA